jgi:hypothetical protein
VSEADEDSDFRIAFPLEIVIGQTPVSFQTDNKAAKANWQKIVGRFAQSKIYEFREWYELDDRPLAATIYYFPPGKMQGDIDNIVKPILDGMIAIAYKNDNCIERVVAQRFDPGVSHLFSAPSATLQTAINGEKPAVYIRVEDHQAWREVS